MNKTVNSNIKQEVPIIYNQEERDLQAPHGSKRMSIVGHTLTFPE